MLNRVVIDLAKGNTVLRTVGYVPRILLKRSYGLLVAELIKGVPGTRRGAQAGARSLGGYT